MLSNRWASLRPAIFVVVACLLMLALQGWNAWTARSEKIQEIQGTLANLAESLAQQAADTIELADAALDGLVERLEIDGTTPAALVRLDRRLAAEVAAQSRFRDINILGADGRWLASSQADKMHNSADLPPFLYHSSHSGRQIYVGAPIKSRITGRWVITVSRRFDQAGGVFAGAVVVVIEVAYFVDHFAGYDLGPNSSISLFATDGVLLARYPYDEQSIGRSFHNARLFRELQERPGGSYETNSAVDGVLRFNGYRRGDQYPIVVVAAMSKEHALATWREDVLADLLVTGALTGGITVLGLNLMRHMRRSRAAEERMRESEERSRLLLHINVTEALYLLDPDGKVQSWNAGAERIKGYTAAEIIGRNFAMFFTPEDAASGEPARILNVARESGSYDGESWRVRKDGSRFLARVALDAVRRSDGTLRGFVKTTTDVTHQRVEQEQRDELVRSLGKARDDADQANQAKSRFLAAITHELRTPLHGILGYAELLSLEGKLSATQSDRLEAMTAAGQHLLTTINAVLDMSQIEADQIELRPVAIELTDVLSGCLDVIRPVADAKGLALVLAPGPPFHLFADATRLQQVLINLLGNAVKFTQAGSIEVRLRQIEGGKCLRVEVADTGPGIWARHRDKLFQRFERLNAETVGGIEGTGLGLALSARLVQLMGGRIGHEDNPGGGSVFWFELPLLTIPDRAAEVAALPPLTAKPRLQVLVVDDEALNREIAARFLQIAGHRVVCVDNGAAAIDVAATTDFDVILMDVRMAGMNGLEATRRIRALPAPRGRVRVVAVTAQAFSQQIELCRQAGMDGHVSKPFKQSVLLAALETPSAAAMRADPALPLLDRSLFEEIATTLSAAELAENLRILITRAETLLPDLCGDGVQPPAGELAEAAHKLAGGAGTFGFMAVAAAARQFEASADSNASDTAARATHLAATITASMTIIREQLVAVTAQAA